MTAKKNISFDKKLTNKTTFGSIEIPKDYKSLFLKGTRYYLEILDDKNNFVCDDWFTLSNTNSTLKFNITKGPQQVLVEYFEPPKIPDDVKKTYKVKITNYTDSDFCAYYSIYKQLVKLHQDLSFGNGSPLAQNFTENLCRYLLELKTIVGKEFDAIDAKGQKIEIKATIDEDGTTTINPQSKFDFLYWMHFGIKTEEEIKKGEIDTLTIKIAPYSAFEQFLNDNKKTKKGEDKKRVTITLKNYQYTDTKTYTINLESNTIQELK